MSYESPVRAALRQAIVNCLSDSGEAMTVSEITAALSDEDPHDIARLCYELRVKFGQVEFGEPKFSKAHGKEVKTYQVKQSDGAALTKAQPKKPSAWSHPWTRAVVPPKTPQEPRITRPLPLHLQSVKEPVAPAETAVEESFTPAIDLDSELIAALQETTTEEETMTEETAEYEAPIPAFVLETQQQDADLGALSRATATLDEILLTIHQAKLAFAAQELRGNRVWMQLERAESLALAGVDDDE